MKTFGRFVVLVLPLALGSVLSAQQSSSSPRSHNDSAATASKGFANHGATQAHGTTRSFVPEPPKTDSNSHNNNPPRYHYNGGFAYYPYYYGAYNSYAPSVPLSNPLLTGQTATDRLIANGGTFTRVDSAPGEVPPQNDPPTPSARTASADDYPTTGVGSALPTTFAGDASRIPEMNSPAVDENPAILVFADGHTMEVRNYAVFAGSVIVLGGERRRIPMNLLDLKATMAANDEAGYTFRIPAVYLK